MPNFAVGAKRQAACLDNVAGLMANGISHELLHESPHLAVAGFRFLKHLAHHPGRSGRTESCPVGHLSDSDVVGTRAGGVLQRQV